MRIFVGFSPNTELQYPLLFAIPVAAGLGTLALLLPRRGQIGVLIGITAIATVWCGVQMVYHAIFQVHLTLYSVSVGVGQAMGFADATFSAILSNWFPLLMLLVPLAVLCVFGRKWIGTARASWLQTAIGFGVAVLLQLLLLLVLWLGPHTLHSPYDLYFQTANVDLSMEKLGLLTTTRLDLQRLWFGSESSLSLETGSLQLSEVSKPEPELPSEPEPTEESSASSPPEQPTESEQEPTDPQEQEPAPEPEPVIDTSPNVLSIDFDALLAESPNDTVTTLHQYFQNAEPTNRNEYTGYFKDYNLIMLTAEAFSYLAVDPEITPTLYKLVNTGFVFNNFYNPIWGVSTSDGEYVACTGLIPKSGVWSFYRSGEQGNDMQFCLGNQFRAQGYQTNAYHNHTYTYYGRDVSHPNMGYDYQGVGNGLEVRTTWPESDLEMMELSVDDYINADRFHAYYMTVSGHLYYTYMGNAMATKNKDLVIDLPMSEEAQAYMACQIELDRALEYLIDRLEEAGKLENTVIVLSADHYPYGLAKETMDELAGHTVEENFELYKSNFIIWNAAMEQPVIVDKPCCSLDVLPTVLNLFDLPYDSRMLAGRDILSDSEPLVILSDLSFITDKAMYNANTKEVTMLDAQYRPLPDAPVDLPDGYITAHTAQITNRFQICRAILDSDYYAYIPDTP